MTCGGGTQRAALSWEEIGGNPALCDRAFLTADFDLYMSKEHKNNWAQIRISLFSSISNLFKMAAKKEKSDLKSSSKM